MISGTKLRELAAKNANVFSISFPAGPTTPAFTLHYATSAQAEKAMAGATLAATNHHPLIVEKSARELANDSANFFYLI